MSQSKILSRLAFLTVSTWFALAEAGAANVTGRVFHDLNGNGVCDSGEPGLADVRVSDGRQIATSDAQGRYRLEIGDDATVFVIKPRGYRSSVDKFQLPRFYYHHVPHGTQDSTYVFKGIEATGKLPENVDFPLYAQKESDNFKVLLIADPQAYNAREITYYLQDAVPEMAGQKPAFGIALGDLVGNNLDMHPYYVEANAKTGFPWYNVIGNHDLNFDAPTDVDADCSFRRVFGPSSYVFQYASAHFVILDNIYWKGRSLNKNGGLNRDTYEGRLRPEQLAFVKAYLDSIPKDELVVICTHIPMVYREPGKNPMLTPQFPELLGILSGHPNTVSLSGHMHFTYGEYFGAESGYVAGEKARHLHLSAPAASGSWFTGPLDEDGIPVTLCRDGTPHGYLWLEVDGHGYSVRFKGLRKPESEQLRLHVPETIAHGATVPLVVNFFLGNEASVVKYRLEGEKDWRLMKRQVGMDPAYQALLGRVNPLAKQGGYRKMPEQVTTDHLWVASLPGDLQPGLHGIEVEATDSFGRSSVGRAYTRVLAENDPWLTADKNTTRK